MPNMITDLNKNKFNTLTRYVRVRSAPEETFVEFDFAIEYPDLFVELVLPKKAFELFCKRNNVAIEQIETASGNPLFPAAIKQKMWAFGFSLK